VTGALAIDNRMAAMQNKQIDKALRENRNRLRDFIRRRIDDVNDAEDVLQDVFEEFTIASRLMEPIEQAASWLITVARNKIIDRYRKKKPDWLEEQTPPSEDDELFLADILPAPDDASIQNYDSQLIWTAVEEALNELPASQRDVFVMHELEGKSFNEISEATGVSVNTLLSRKRYAVLYLRDKLRYLYNEMFYD